MLSNNVIVLRQWRPNDRGFVIKTWLDGAWAGNEYFKEVDEDLFKSVYSTIIQSIVERPETKITVACLAEDDTVIVGFSVVRELKDRVLDWVFVRPTWRGKHIAKELVGTVDWVTHLTKPGRAIKWQKKLKFNPFL